jgi:hypothetical protein
MMDSFGFPVTSVPHANGTRRCGRLRNHYTWVSLPVEAMPALRYRELYRNKAKQIMVKDPLGNQVLLKRVCKDFSLHREKPE